MPRVSSRPGSNREPMTAAALKVRLATGSRRSMRAAMVACLVANPPTEESGPSSSATSAAVSESSSGARAMLCAPGTRLNAPRYSGR